MRILTRTEKTIRKHRNRVRSRRKPGIKVRPHPKKLRLKYNATHLVGSNRGRNVPYNEDIIDVTHLTPDQQTNLFMLLRTGRDVAGKPRYVDGVRKDRVKGIIPETYMPSKDTSLVLS